MSLSRAGFVQQNQQEYKVSGDVDFLTVPDLVRQALSFFKESFRVNKITSKPAMVTVDLSQVTSSNSAGLAMILEMAKDAQQNNIELHFNNLPDTLQTIAKAYGVENEIRDICR